MDQVNIPLLKGFGLHLDGAKIFWTDEQKQERVDFPLNDFILN